MPWSAPFDEPIALKGGRKLTTLQQAADYVMKLPERAQQQQHWQIAVENLINAAESGGGWMMFAPDRDVAGVERRRQKSLATPAVRLGATTRYFGALRTI